MQKHKYSEPTPLCAKPRFYSNSHDIQAHVGIHTHSGQSIAFHNSWLIHVFLERHLTCTWHNPQCVLSTSSPTDIVTLRLNNERLEIQQKCHCLSKWNMLYIAYASLCHGPWSGTDTAVTDSAPCALTNWTPTFQLLRRMKYYTVKETQRLLRAGHMKANSSKDSTKNFFFPPLLVTVAPVNSLVKKVISSNMQLMVLCLACSCTVLWFMNHFHFRQWNSDMWHGMYGAALSCPRG